MSRSPKETHRRHDELLRLLGAGEISDLVVGPNWPVSFNAMLICVVEADFAYRHVQRGTTVAEFVNPKNSASHAIKKKLLKACHGIEPVEVRV